jgi:hypothetical protein
MERSPDNRSIAEALRRLNGSEQKHLIAGIRSMFGCRVLPYNAALCERAWATLSAAQKAAVIRHVLQLYENSRVAS